jgi:gliding motility-associated-like protein
LTPDNLSNNVTLYLTETDTLVAVYRVIPHFDVTVMVDPPGTGEVLFADIYNTNTFLSATLESGVPFSLRADANEFYDFKGFTSIGNDFVGSPQLENVQYNLVQQDTIVAHFERQPFAYYVPNSFSPNGDGLNEVFKVEGNALDIEVFDLAIYNRWGEQVFATQDMTKGWEGDYKKGDYYVRDDVYTYTLKVKSVFDQSPKELRGTITIFR